MNGIIIINKPKGYTSHDIVNIVRKKLNIKKVGHTGTLDPNATGVLPILIGQATKVSKYLIEHDKTYIATLKLGEKTNTGDSTGEIIQKSSIETEYTENQIQNVLKSFLGKQEQTPPIYSAIKVNGKKAYEYARQNEKVELKARQIEIYTIKLLLVNSYKITFEVKCSKGTYIRTLCESIAEKLETIGHMEDLQRTEVNNFKIEDSIDLEDISDRDIINIENIFKEKEKIFLKEKEINLFLNGVNIKYDLHDNVYRIYYNENFIGLGIIKNKLLKRDIII